MSEHQRFEEKIEQLFCEQELAAPEWRELQAHLTTCDGCRRYYDKVGALSLSMGERSFLGMSNIEAVVVGRALEAKRSPFTRRLFWVLSAPVAALLAFLLVSGFSTEGEAPSDPTFQPRGDQNGHPVARLRPLCTDGKNGLLGDTLPAENDAGRLTRCTLQSDLVFTVLYDGEPSRARYLFVVGFDERGFPLWYTPKPNQEKSLPLLVQPNTQQRIPGSTRVGVNHVAGKVRVFALFSQSPITITEISAAAQELRKQEARFVELTALPLRRTDVITTFADLEVAP